MPQDSFGNYVTGLTENPVSVQGGGIVTSQEAFNGHGDPNGVVTPTGSAATYYDLDNGDFWNWNGSAWE